MSKLTFAIFVLTAVVAVFGDKNAQITSFQNDVKDNGLYTYRYDTTNGISQSENGFGGYSTGGSVQYISPEGIPISLQYEADANGFRARGAHIPTSPPIPDYILKSIEYNLREAKTKNLNYQ